MNKNIFTALLLFTPIFANATSTTIASAEIDEEWIVSFKETGSFYYTFGYSTYLGNLFNEKLLKNGDSLTMYASETSTYSNFITFIEKITNGSVDKFNYYKDYLNIGGGGGGIEFEDSFFDYIHPRYSGLDLKDFVVEDIRFIIQDLDINYSALYNHTSYSLKGRIEIIGTPKIYPTYPLEYNSNATILDIDSSVHDWIPINYISYNVVGSDFMLSGSDLPQHHLLIQYSNDLKTWKDLITFSASENEFSIKFALHSSGAHFFRFFEKMPN